MVCYSKVKILSFLFKKKLSFYNLKLCIKNKFIDQIINNI